MGAAAVAAADWGQIKAKATLFDFLTLAGDYGLYSSHLLKDFYDSITPLFRLSDPPHF